MLLSGVGLVFLFLLSFVLCRGFESFSVSMFVSFLGREFQEEENAKDIRVVAGNQGR